MALKLGMTGMDGSTQAALTDAFAQANSASGGRFTLVPSSDAEFVIVDMDSLYGPMSFMQLHNAGKHVIGYTQASRTQADSRLGRPLDTMEFTTLLSELSQPAGAAQQDHQPVPGSAVASVQTAPSLAASAATLARTEPAARATEPFPAEAPQSTAAELQPLAAAGATPAPAPIDELPAERASAPGPIEAPKPSAAIEPEPPRELVFADWLEAGRLTSPVIYARPNGPELLIDPLKREYRGPGGLKPLMEHFSGGVTQAHFRPVADADLVRTAGTSHSLTRLIWLAGLMEGNGKLAQGVPPDAEFRLVKWPQTEREYPKHFRIATVMMKGPATLAQIAEVAQIPEADVADFINATLATGFSEAMVNGTPMPLSGRIGRLRNR